MHHSLLNLIEANENQMKLHTQLHHCNSMERHSTGVTTNKSSQHPKILETDIIVR